MERKMRTGLVLAAAVIMVFAFALLPQNQAYAGLDQTSVTFDGSRSAITISATSPHESIDNIVVGGANPEAIYYGSVMREENSAGDMVDCFEVKPYRTGTCKITVYNYDNTVLGTVTVTVTQAAIDDMFEWDHVRLNDFRYGASYLRLGEDYSAWQGTEYDLTIGGDHYEGTVDYDMSDGRIKLKKVYKIGTKVTGTIWNDLEDGRKSSYTITSDDYFCCDSYVAFRATAKTKNKKKVTIYIYEASKGDVVKVTYKGKTYTKKVTKKYNRKSFKYTITMKHAMKNGAKIKVNITNKYKQKMIKNGIYRMRSWDTDKYYDED